MLKNAPNNALRQAELLAKLIEMAERGITPDGDEDTYFAGYNDGAVTFARDLCDLLELKYKDYDNEEDT